MRGLFYSQLRWYRRLYDLSLLYKDRSFCFSFSIFLDKVKNGRRGKIKINNECFQQALADERKTIMKKTRIFAAATAAAMTIGAMSACSSTQSGGDEYTVAIVQPMSHPSLDQIRAAIESTITAGDSSVKIVYKNAEGDASMLTTIMQDLVSSNVDVIVPIATNTAQAAMAATSDIPIVFSAVSTPVEAGLVPSFDETNGNITGVSDAISVEDIFGLAAELTPDAKTFGFVYCTSEINSVTGIERAKEYCDANGLSYKEATVTTTADIQQAVTSIAGEVDAFFTLDDNTVASAMPTYAQVASDAGKPIYVGADTMVKDGGLATVGIDYDVLGKQTGELVLRLHNGEAISDNHVERVSEFAKMINTDTASALGINIPESLEGNFEIITNN